MFHDYALICFHEGFLEVWFDPMGRSYLFTTFSSWFLRPGFRRRQAHHFSSPDFLCCRPGYLLFVPWAGLRSARIYRSRFLERRARLQFCSCRLAPRLRAVGQFSAYDFSIYRGAPVCWSCCFPPLKFLFIFCQMRLVAGRFRSVRDFPCLCRFPLKAKSLFRALRCSCH
jgi:hypothetical protein